MSQVERAPLSIRVAVSRRELGTAFRTLRLRDALRSLLALVAPGRWPQRPAVRAAVLEAAVRNGDRSAAGLLLADLKREPDAGRPGSPVAIQRALALELLATTLPPDRQAVELAVVGFLRGDLLRPPAAGPVLAPPLDRATSAALRLRKAGHADPIVVATFPGWKTNPYGQLMEREYEPNGLVAIHVDGVEEVDAIVNGAAGAGFRVVVHCNAPDRFVRAVQSDEEAQALGNAVVEHIDRWLAAGAVLVTSIHNRAIHVGRRGVAEQLVAQALVDRASVVHILARDTPELLAGWIRIDPARIVHVPHPNYDGIYPDPPDPATARRWLGIEDDGEPPQIVVGLVGTLADRKGGLLLFDALERVPDPLPSGRRLRVVIAGMPTGVRSEDLIRRALSEPRITARFGFIPDGDLPILLGALDVAIVPYAQMLNSGWLHLALTEGLPVIAPVGGTAPGIVHPAGIRTFTAGDAGSLAATLARVAELTTDDARGAARASVADLDAETLSGAFVQAVRAAVDRAGTEAPR